MQWLVSWGKSKLLFSSFQAHFCFFFTHLFILLSICSNKCTTRGLCSSSHTISIKIRKHLKNSAQKLGNTLWHKHLLKRRKHEICVEWWGDSNLLHMNTQNKQKCHTSMMWGCSLNYVILLHPLLLERFNGTDQRVITISCSSWQTSS